MYTGRRYNSIQILRGISIIPIFFFHQTLAGEKFYSWGVWGVSVFFIVSGLLSGMSKRTEEMISLRSSLEYGVRKIHRVFPFHVLMLVVALVLWIAANMSEITADPAISIPANAVKFILNLLLISDWIPRLPVLLAINGEYNIVTWFLSACLLYYILTPVIRRFMHRLYDDKDRRRPYIAMACLLAYSVVWYLIFRRLQSYAYAYWYIYECPLARIADYVLGMHLGYVMQREQVLNKAILRTMLVVSVVLSALLVLYATFVLRGKYDLIVSTGFYYMIPVALLIYSAVSLESTQPCSPSHLTAPFIWLGGLSSYVYLCQVPIINGVHGVYKRVFGMEIPMGIWAVISIMLTIVVSFIGSRVTDKYLITTHRKNEIDGQK